MKKLFPLIFMMLLALGTVSAQCPGPAQRTNLINLQKSQSVEGTLAGQIPITDDCGNQRYGQYVEVENTPVGFVPTATGNTSNYSEFVIASDSTRWYIDWQGRGYLFGAGGGSDRNGYYGGNGGNGGDATVPSVTKSTLTNQLTFYRATDAGGGLVPIRIEVAAGSEPDFMSFRNLTDSMTIKRSDQDFEIRCSNGISMFGNTSATPGNGGISLFANTSVIILSADSVQVGTVPNNFTGERTFLTQSPGGFITKQEGISAEDLTFTPANIYNSNGNIPNGREANVLGTFNLACEDHGVINMGDVLNDFTGDGLKVDATNSRVLMGNIFGASTYYIISGQGAAGNYIRTPASNLQQGAANTIWDILTGNFRFTDNRAVKKGLEYSADYCTAIKANGLSIPSVDCVASIIHDSLLTLPAFPLPNGTIHQTLRFSATNVLQATSEIYNNGTQVSIGTTVFPSAYELYVLGDVRINRKLRLGSANGLADLGATLATNDSTTSGSQVRFANKSSQTGADMDVTIQSGGTDNQSAMHWISNTAESQANMGWLSSDNSFRLSMDPSGKLETETVFTILTSPPYNIGVGVTDPTAQMEFAASVDENSNSYPIKFRAGSALDTKSEGGLNYYGTVGPVTNDLNITVGTTDHILHKGFKGSAALDFGALLVLGTESLPITVTGAAIGDQCIVAEPAAAAADGVIYTCRISGANTARVTVLNATSAGFNPGAGTFNVRVFH